MQASKERCIKHNSLMKNSRQILSVSLATGTAGVAVFASLLPSLRAARIDPLVAFRTD